MSISTHTGMNTYNRILQEARSNGDPIGPKHHEYSKHLKLYLAKQKNKVQLAKARETKKTVGTLRKTRVAINEAKAKLETKTAEVSEQERIRELHKKLQMQKIADGYKVDRDGSQFKSRGNGL